MMNFGTYQEQYILERNKNNTFGKLESKNNALAVLEHHKKLRTNSFLEIGTKQGQINFENGKEQF